MDDDPRVRLALPDDGEAEGGQVDPLLDDLEWPIGMHRRLARDAAERQRIEARAQLSHESCRRSSATPTFTLAPSAYAGPTQLGQPSAHGQLRRCSAARSRSGSVDLKRRSEKPTPPGVMSNR